MLETFEKAFQKLDQTSSIAYLRQSAWEAFTKLGLPTKKSEAFRYFPLSKLYASEVATKEPQWDDQEIISMPLEEAFITYRAVIEKAFLETIKKEDNPFALLQLAVDKSARFIYVPPGREATIQMDTQANCFVFIGRGAQVEMKQKESSLSTFANWHVFQEAGSRLVAATHFIGSHKTRLEHLRFTLKRDANLKLFSYSEGGEALRQDIRVDLLEENGHVDLRGLCVLSEKNQHHTYVHVHHAAPNCHSNQHFKGVLFDAAKTSFEGKIYVESIAQQTRAYQLNNNLVLGGGAVANSKPNLEIFADDVKASHGATVTQIAPEELFYLQSRGIDKQAAKKLLIKGFCSAFFQEAPQELKKYGV